MIRPSCKRTSLFLLPTAAIPPSKVSINSHPEKEHEEITKL